MAIWINLPTYNVGKEFKKEDIKSFFPGSMIDLALHDTEAICIDITVPVVTPDVLEYMMVLISGIIPPIPVRDMTAASRYLGIPILGIVSSGHYESFLPMINLNNLHDLHYYYQPILRFSIIYAWVDLTRYLLEHAPDGKDDVNNEEILFAGYHDQVSIYDLLRSLPSYSPIGIPTDLFLGVVCKESINVKYLPPKIHLIHAAALGKAHNILKKLRDTMGWKEAREALLISVHTSDLESIEVLRDHTSYPSWSPSGFHVALDDATKIGDLRILSKLLSCSPTPLDILMSTLTKYPNYTTQMIDRIPEITSSMILDLILRDVRQVGSLMDILRADKIRNNPSHINDIFQAVVDQKCGQYYSIFRIYIPYDRLLGSVLDASNPSDIAETLTLIGVSRSRLEGLYRDALDRGKNDLAKAIKHHIDT